MNILMASMVGVYMATGCMGCCTLHPQVRLLHTCAYDVCIGSELVCVFTGEYSFIIEMTQVTCACSVEFWLSTSADPMNLRKILAAELPYTVNKISIYWSMKIDRTINHCSKLIINHNAEVVIIRTDHRKQGILA